jgi:hypothetical protein
MALSTQASAHSKPRNTSLRAKTSLSMVPAGQATRTSCASTTSLAASQTPRGAHRGGTHLTWTVARGARCATMPPTLCASSSPGSATSGSINRFRCRAHSTGQETLPHVPCSPRHTKVLAAVRGSAGFVVQACHKSSFSINTGVAVRSPYGTVKWVDGGPWVIECSTDTECPQCSDTTCVFPDGERVSMSGIRIWLSLPHSHCGHVEGLCGRYVSRLPADGACCCCGAPLPARCVRCSLHSSLTDPDSPALRCPCLHC